MMLQEKILILNRRKSWKTLFLYKLYNWFATAQALLHQKSIINERIDFGKRTIKKKEAIIKNIFYFMLLLIWDSIN